jgi:hypothetical protein
MADSIEKVTALTVITPIIPEKLEALKAVLQGIQENPSSTIAMIGTIHFARWVIIDDGKRLLFTSNFDGSLMSYLKDFVNKMPDGLDAIWGACVGYPGSRPFEPFVKYVKDNSYTNNCFYPSYPDLTVQDVLNGKKWRDAGVQFLKNAPA